MSTLSNTQGSTVEATRSATLKSSAISFASLGVNNVEISEVRMSDPLRFGRVGCGMVIETLDNVFSSISAN